MAEKSYNPFKMRGSWIGGGLYAGLIFLPFFIAFFGLELSGLGWFLIPLFLFGIFYSFLIDTLQCGGDILCVIVILLILLISVFIEAIIGFLVGWGIHSLIRRLKK